MKPAERLPLYLDLNKRLVVIVGGGAAAAEKLRGLLCTGCHLRLVSPEISAETRALIAQWPKEEALYIESAYEPSHLEGAWLVYAATSLGSLNHEIVELCSAKRIWANSVDDPAHSRFYSCSQLRKGPWRFAIATDGQFAGLSKLLRETLEAVLPEEDAQSLEEIARFRQRLMERLPDPAKRREALKGILGALREKYLGQD